MLNIVITGRGSLSALAHRAGTGLRAFRRGRADRIALRRLIGEDDHLLKDIGLTRDDVAAMLAGQTARR